MFHYAKNDSDWSAKVLAKNNGYCILCGSEATPAHIFRRGDQVTRLVIENGIPLCIKHHNWFDGLSIDEHEVVSKILLGDALYLKLKGLNKL